MKTVTVSPRFQIVIPQAIREAMGLLPGAKMQVVHYENRIELIPVRSSRSLRGSLKGLNSEVSRERDRIC